MQYVHHPHAYRPDYDPANYWNSTLEIPTGEWPPLTHDLQTEVAVIGAGFTGLNAALQLAEEHQTEVCILDAAGAGWGASGRNGGFVCLGGSAHDPNALVKQHGQDTARHYFRTQRDAIETVADNLTRYSIDADRHSDGEWLLAGKASHIDYLKAHCTELKQAYGTQPTFYPKAALKELGMNSPVLHGATHNPVGFALNPAKYSQGLARAVLSKGIRIYGHSQVQQIAQQNGHFILHSNGCTITAKRLLIATNGYTPDRWVDSLSSRIMPVSSNILVTEPISEELLQEQGWTSHQMSYTSQKLLNYFRLMPNGRMLLGLRGNVEQSPEAIEAVRGRARRRFEAMFPTWKNVETPYFWSGVLAMSRHLNPYIGPVPGMKGAYASLAYHGNGVAMGSHSGRLVADLIAGTQKPEEIPLIMRQELPVFPLGKSRLWLLRMAYWAARAKDHFS
ncbi:MAG: NAD(P)/FAD-dependent oxidoreductase [Thiolinea sp.]